MKNIFKRVVAIFVAVIMLVGVLPITTSASTVSTPITIAVSKINGYAGGEVKVTIALQNNPGISSMKLKVAYDSTLMLIDTEYNSEMGGQSLPPQTTNSPVTLTWVSPFADYTEDAIFATLTFKIDENAANNTVSNISVTYNPDDIYDMSETNIPCVVDNGSVTVVSPVPGDINGDQKANNKDITRMFQYMADWDVSVNEVALDTNGDGSINNKDLTRLFQYLADWDVDIYCNGKLVGKCNHSMTATTAKEATCTVDGNIAYWYCSLCEKYFSDAEGQTEVTKESTVIEASHTEVTVPGYGATLENEGKTDGIQCSVCKEWIQEQETIPANGHKIKYNHSVYKVDENGNVTSTAVTDAYFNKLVEDRLIIINTPNVFASTEKVDLSADPIATGYDFHGWYLDGQRVYSIPQGTTEDIVLTAHWSVHEYSITLYKNKHKISDEIIYDTYTVDKGYTLNPITWTHYLFVAWTDVDGNVIKKIEPGTTGDKEFVANWTSERNQTIPEKNNQEPLLIHEDAENAKFFFTYKVGSIVNVPLYVIKDFSNTLNTDITVSYNDSTTGSVIQTQADEISEMISNATTSSGSWTLSEEWNDKTSISENHINEVTEETIISAIESRNSSGSWNLSQYNEGKDESVLNTETYAKVEASLSAGVGVGPYKVEASLGTEMGESVTTSDSSMRYWNTNEGYSSSYNNNSTSSFSNALKQSVITDIGSTQEKGHNLINSETVNKGTSTEEERKYVSELAFTKGTIEASAISFTSNESTPKTGKYRYVGAGKVHVYAIICYDAANSTYFTYTYSVLDDEVVGWIDYSYDGTFDDYSNGVLPFEVPGFVNDYIDERILESEGLKVNSEGIIYEYDQNADAKTVIIPEYHVMDNDDGTYSAIKVTGILASEKVFQGNTKIEKVIIGKNVTTLSNGVFEGCTGLKQVIGSGVTSIEENAFKGCTSLEKYIISENITHLEVNAFEGVSEIEAHASSKLVAEAAAASGANNILLDISPVLKQTDVDKKNNITIDVGAIEKFELRGYRNEYYGLSIDSRAKTTIINGITIPSCVHTIPLKLNSSTVKLVNVSINSIGTSLLLKNENTSIDLKGKIQLESSNGNTVVAKNTILSTSDYGELSVTGNVLVFGTLYNQELLTSGTVQSITEEEYNSFCSVVSDWILESEAPSGATVIAEKWTYNQIITSDKPEVDGYELYDTEWSEYSDWSETAPDATAGRDIQTKEVVDKDGYNEYAYFRYVNNRPVGSNSAWSIGHYCQRCASLYYGTTTDYWPEDQLEWNWFTTRLTAYDTWSCGCGNTGYKYRSANGVTWYFERTRYVEPITHTEYRYRDVTYYLTKTEATESMTEIVPAENIVNVQKWVKYIVE